MEITKFLILTNDRDYGEALCRCARDMQNPISFSYASEIPEDAESYSLIAADKSLEEKCADELADKKIPYCFLVDEISDENCVDRKHTGKAEKGCFRVWKFRQLSGLILTLSDIYACYTGSAAGNAVRRHGRCKLYTVTSSIGGEGASSVSMGLAKDFAYGGNHKTLYISLYDHHQELNFARTDSRRNLREFLYDLCYGQKKYCMNIEAYMTEIEDNLYVFNVSGGQNELVKITEEEFRTFIDYICNMNFFERIIADVGTGFRERWKCVYSTASCNILMNSLVDSWYQEQFWMDFRKRSAGADKVIVVENRAPYVQGRLDMLYEDDDEERETVSRKLVQYISAAQRRDDEGGYSENARSASSRKVKNEKVRIVEDPDAFSRTDGLLKISMDSGFARGIRELASALAVSGTQPKDL